MSVIVPVLNEEGNVVPLYNEIDYVLKDLLNYKKISNYEIIFINDGSRDMTQNMLESIKTKRDKLVIIELKKNFGQTAALRAGFDHASGDVIVTMDGDMQNDPRDIPRLLDALTKGYDVVSGWRYNRQDSIGKTLSSIIMKCADIKLMIIISQY